MIEVDGKVEDRSGHGLVIDQDARFVEVPSTGSDDECCRLLAQLVGFAVDLEINLASDSVAEVDLTIDEISESRGARI